MELEEFKKKYPKNLEIIYDLTNEDLKNIDICNYLIDKNGLNIHTIPINVLKNNIDLCYKAISKNWLSITYIKEEILISDLYFDEERKLERSKLAELAIKNCFLSINYLPESFLNRCEYLYLLALKKDLLTIRYMPLNIQTKYRDTIIDEIIYKKAYFYFKDINPSILNQDIYEKIFNEDVHNIKYIPKEFRTIKMQDAVNQDMKNTSIKIERINETIIALQERVNKINEEINRLNKEKILIKKW